MDRLRGLRLGVEVGFLTYAFAGSTEEGLTVLADKTAGAVRGTISNASHLSHYSWNVCTAIPITSLKSR